MLLVIGLGGCNPNLNATVRARGATDLDCPVDDVNAYRAAGGLIVARGCEKWIEYACFYSRWGDPVCLRQSDARPTPEG